ncbi:MAG: hypothetical protein JJT96_17930, partial [Opitutales bacterium]|nr:hypothetical protein [Opitutales bacterium]
LKARMGDISVFMREVKTRFTLWYNRKRGMVGTFWAERFRSVIVEADAEAQRMVAAYIDLNPVRAGLVEDAGGLWFQWVWGGVRGWQGRAPGDCPDRGPDDLGDEMARALPCAVVQPDGAGNAASRGRRAEALQRGGG